MTMLRHLVATLAYRAAKVVRDAPPDFASASFGAATRQPVRILAHIGDLLDWALTLARGNASWSAGGSDDWDAEVARYARAAIAAGRVGLDQAPPEREFDGDASRR